jgi:hypothetical protein
MYSIRIIFLFILVSCSTLHAQSDLKKTKEWKVKGVNLISIDRLGNFFLLQKNGKIKKYDPQGNVLASLSGTSPTLIEPWYHPSIFIYSRSQQKYNVYGRNFENPKEYTVEPAFAIEPSLVCPTHDNKLWIFDKADQSLKKVNPLTNEVLQEFTVSEVDANSNSEFTYLREYLNLIFLLDKNSGILILNHLGKVIEKIDVKNLTQFHFFGEDLYYLENNTLEFIDLLTDKRHELILPAGTQQAIITDEIILTINSRSRAILYTYSMGGQ